LEYHRIQVHLDRAIEQLDQLGLLLPRAETSTRGPVHVVDRGDPHPAKLARYWRRQAVRTLGCGLCCGGCGGGEKCDWSRHLAKERKDTICHYISISCRGTSRPHGFRECQRLFDVAAQTLQHHSVGSLGGVPLGSLDHLGY